MAFVQLFAKDLGTVAEVVMRQGCLLQDGAVYAGFSASPSGGIELDKIFQYVRRPGVVSH